MTKLDRKRSYGTVYGEPNVGFVQDEKYFRHDGTLHEPPPPAVPEKHSAEVALNEALKRVEPRAVSEERKAAQSEAMKKIWAERRAAKESEQSSSGP